MDHLTDLFALDYLGLNLLIGLGIAADAIVATLARAHRIGSLRAALAWAGAIGLTHWLLPMIGFFAGFYVAWSAPAARAWVYGVAGLIMTAFVWTLLRDDAETRAPPGWARWPVTLLLLPVRLIEGIGRGVARALRLTGEARLFWAAVWAVSVDALVTGPGKTGATAQWSEVQLWFSFVLVGLTVFTVVLSAALVALRLSAALDIESPTGRRWHTALFWVEIAIFEFFALLAFAEAIGFASPGIAAGLALLGVTPATWVATRSRQP